MTSPTLLPLRQAARIAGCHPRTLLRRLKALQAAADGPPALRSFAPPGKPVRKWWVAPNALQQLLALRGEDAEEEDSQLARVLSRVQNVENRQRALKSQIREIKRHLTRHA